MATWKIKNNPEVLAPHGNILWKWRTAECVFERTESQPLGRALTQQSQASRSIPQLKESLVQ